MAGLDENLTESTRARLFPIVGDGAKERRITSILLALLPIMPELAEKLLASCEVRLGKLSKVDTFVEVPLGSDALRPDGIIKITTARSSWTALVESKIGKAVLEENQVAEYVKLAREFGVDAVITISNQFVARPDHPPVQLTAKQLGKVKLFHWSWIGVQTNCELLRGAESVEDKERIYMLEEFLKFLEHNSTGVDRFIQMNRGWPDVSRAVSSNQQLRKNDENVAETVAAWFQEQHDLSLQLSRKIARDVKIRISNKHKRDPVERLRDGIDQLIKDHTLSVSFPVENAAGDVVIIADLARRTVTASMSVKAPEDRKSTRARLNWLLRMLKGEEKLFNSAKAGKFLIHARWPSVSATTSATVADLMKDPDLLPVGHKSASARSFEIHMVEELGARFASRKKFIEITEALLDEFYLIFVSKIKQWQPPPPQPVETAETELPNDPAPVSSGVPPEISA